MNILNPLKNFVFRLRYGFRGVPLSFQGRILRLDESLRRWSPKAESEVQAVLCECLKPGDIFVDVGANFGLHTLLGASCVGPTGRVYAVEPIPFNQYLLERNIALNDFQERVTVIPMAAADTAGGFLEMHGANEGLTFAASLGKSANAGVSVKVRVTTLDECLKDRPRPVNLIKIDVEGAEHLVLHGARQIIEKDRPGLLIEVHSFALPSFNSSDDSLRQELKQLGYQERLIDRVEGAEGSYFHALYQPDPVLSQKIL
jgi:FkbM family methyltransferase